MEHQSFMCPHVSFLINFVKQGINATLPSIDFYNFIIILSSSCYKKNYTKNLFARLYNLFLSNKSLSISFHEESELHPLIVIRNNLCLVASVFFSSNLIACGSLYSGCLLCEPCNKHTEKG